MIDSSGSSGSKENDERVRKNRNTKGEKWGAVKRLNLFQPYFFSLAAFLIAPKQPNSWNKQGWDVIER